jgi:hypothetical protein
MTRLEALKLGPFRICERDLARLHALLAGRGTTLELAIINPESKNLSRLQISLDADGTDHPLPRLVGIDAIPETSYPEIG